MESMTIPERIAKVREVVDQLLTVSEAGTLIYSPDEFRNLSLVQLAELLQEMPDADCQKNSADYTGSVRIKGVYTAISTAWGTVSSVKSSARAELSDLLNK